jgi:hypothetical protein
VGETEESLHTKNQKFKITTLPMSFSGRFVAENEGKNGLCKILSDENGKLLGIHLLEILLLSSLQRLLWPWNLALAWMNGKVVFFLILRQVKFLRKLCLNSLKMRNIQICKNFFCNIG